MAGAAAPLRQCGASGGAPGRGDSDRQPSRRRSRPFHAALPRGSRDEPRAPVRDRDRRARSRADGRPNSISSRSRSRPSPTHARAPTTSPASPRGAMASPLPGHGSRVTTTPPPPCSIPDRAPASMGSKRTDATRIAEPSRRSRRSAPTSRLDASACSSWFRRRVSAFSVVVGEGFRLASAFRRTGQRVRLASLNG